MNGIYYRYIQNAPIIWFSKKQGSVEAVPFGSEFLAMKACAEANHGLRYKLRMMGVPIKEPTYVYGDNMFVLYNTTSPESTLKKKSNSIAYHFVRECVAMGELLTGYVSTEENIADLLTKPLPRVKHVELVQRVIWDI